MMRRFPLLAGSALWLAAAACGRSATGVVDAGGVTGRTIDAPAGSTFDIKLQTVGPGEYETPVVSSPAVQFTDVSLASPFVPAGPTQLFRFQAVRPGTAVVTFHHSGMSPAVSDTVVVR